MLKKISDFLITTALAVVMALAGVGLAIPSQAADVEPMVAGSTVKYVRGYETKAPIYTTNTSGTVIEQNVGQTVRNATRICPWNANRKLLIHSSTFSGFLNPGQCWRPSVAGSISAFQFLKDAPEG